MEWATVALVLGSNAIMGGVNWLVTRMQVKHSEQELEKELQAQGEAYKRDRKWEVKSEALMKLREELAWMAERFEGMIDVATQIVEQGSINREQRLKNLGKAVKEWDDYYYSGVFYHAVHMQYDYSLKYDAYKISLDYGSAYVNLAQFLDGGEAGETINEAKDVIGRNSARICEIQSKINKMLEQL